MRCGRTARRPTSGSLPSCGCVSACVPPSTSRCGWRRGTACRRCGRSGWTSPRTRTRGEPRTSSCSDPTSSSPRSLSRGPACAMSTCRKAAPGSRPGRARGMTGEPSWRYRSPSTASPSSYQKEQRYSMSSAKQGGPVHPSTSTWRPLGADEIQVTGGIWGQKQRLNADTILEHCESWMERIGWIGNFDRAAAGTIGAGPSGIEFVDSEIYKLLEAMAWELGREHSGDLERRYQALVERVAAAQRPDGYLHTSFGGVGVCGHPEIEMALVELARATGEGSYLELARLFIERRGTCTLGIHPFGQEYFQDDIPVRQATTMRGHAVRALYLASGALDVATETGDEDLSAAVREQWANGVARRTYITGGAGSHHQDEAFGDDFELPADRAYAETCAGIASVMLSWRLLLATGLDQYSNLIERTLLNNVLASPRGDGRAFYYTNTLHQRTPGSVPDQHQLSHRAESGLRAPWFEVSCCPTNVARTLASVSLYFATASEHGVQLHQDGDYRVSTALGTGTVTLRVSSAY